jgi:hypothetical protein
VDRVHEVGEVAAVEERAQVAAETLGVQAVLR